MTKKYFVISDMHGHYEEMLESLKLNQFDKNNKMHHLLVLGDMFDRGTKSKEILEFIYQLFLEKKATIILGNHESFLIEFLEENYVRAIFNMKMNGFKKTLESFLQRELKDEEDWKKIRNEIISKFSYLHNFLNSLPLYLETKDYIFVHGGIKYGEFNWKENNKRDFIWGRESQFNRIPDKIVVCGHERVSKIRFPDMDQKDLVKSNPDAFNIYKSDGKIHIDAFVEISKKINVLILNIKDEDFT